MRGDIAIAMRSNQHHGLLQFTKSMRILNGQISIDFNQSPWWGFIRNGVSKFLVCFLQLYITDNASMSSIYLWIFPLLRILPESSCAVFSLFPLMHPSDSAMRQNCPISRFHNILSEYDHRHDLCNPDIRTLNPRFLIGFERQPRNLLQVTKLVNWDYI